MKTKLRQIWDALRTSYWFVPALMVASAIWLSVVTVALDQRTNEWFGSLAFTYTRGPEGARAILSTVAGSMMTVAATAFSIAIVALQLASSQFGPRLLRNFMGDTGNQIVLGTFISTFMYTLLVLRTIRAGEESEFVPNISVTLSVFLAIASVGVLIFFIHHTASSIQADTVIAEVGVELDRAIDRLFPKKIGRGASGDSQQPVGEDIPENFDREAGAVLAGKSGYIQAIDEKKLLERATENNLILRLNCRPGNFVVQGSHLLKVWPGKLLNQKLAKEIHEAFIFGNQRTHQQDVEFAVNQLVEIAVRALSPGINDPYTAIRSVDQLSAALSHLAERNIPSAYRYDEHNKLRAIAEPVTFAGVTDTAFNQIRQYGKSSVAVTIRLLEAIAAIAPHTGSESDRAVLLRHAGEIERSSRETVTAECDRKDIESRYQVALKALKPDEQPDEKPE
ncbi:DUF2254 domain-containing protein [Kamptonema formosum]|uniref:DUF2254 domain-containing protein n=1 Tax=Kamptonema formosum TaxID=331992 RepID=UPI0003491920|nr:DUF2254 domain-containing protein [Oscillatoria sp. PCC 10802]